MLEQEINTIQLTWSDWIFYPVIIILMLLIGIWGLKWHRSGKRRIDYFRYKR